MGKLKKLAILGSTGSIGTQALDIVARHPTRFEVAGLVAGRKIDLLFQQIQKFKPRFVSVKTEADAKALQSRVKGSCEVLWGETGAVQVATSSDVELVISGIVGAAGLKPTYEAIRSGKEIALANKESLVIAGEVMTNAARTAGVTLLPVDSEHSAIFQALRSGRRTEVSRIILTASGGPFHSRPKESFKEITVDEALKHPNWSMGPKISVDSATMMNKGLEIIEARWLFDFLSEKIAVQVHPQSIIHSMVEYRDGSVIAQLGTPDMRCAISYAMAFPERIESGVESLSLSKIKTLTFFEPDFEKFTCLKLAWDVAREGGSLPAVLNAANEVAVEGFLKKKIGFLDISRLVAATLEKHTKKNINSIEDVLEADRWSREYCGNLTRSH